MGRKKLSQVLYCHMNDKLIGTLVKSKGELTFTYDAQWINDRMTRPISVSLPLSSEPYTGNSVLAYFDNLLPDDLDVRNQMVDRLGAKSNGVFDLLDAVGRDCVGAITFSRHRNPEPVPDVAVTPVNDSEIAQLIKDSRAGHALGMRNDSTFRFSLAGAQDKTALTYWQGQWGIPIGRTPTTHIIKPRILSRPGQPDLSSSVENEWFCMRLMDVLEFNVAPVEMRSFNDEDALIVERFDRRVVGNKIYRLPQEDFCQALGVNSGSKYEEHGGPSAKEIMKVLSTSSNAAFDQETFMSAQLLYWLLAAIDGHAKNYSLSLSSAGYKMAPLYDVISAHGFDPKGDLHPRKLKMAMAINSKNRHYHWHKIMPRHWGPHAKHLGFSQDRIDLVIANLTSRLPACLDIVCDEASRESEQALIIGEKIRDGTLKARSRFKLN